MSMTTETLTSTSFLVYPHTLRGVAAHSGENTHVRIAITTHVPGGGIVAESGVSLSPAEARDLRARLAAALTEMGEEVDLTE